MALIHTCYRITDVERSRAFQEALGFQEVGRIPIRDEAVNVFMNRPGDGDMLVGRCSGLTPEGLSRREGSTR
jgi:lactoylglutathione lyase